MANVMSKKNYKFNNAASAMTQCNSLIMWYAIRNLLCTSTIDLEHKRIELNVFIKDLTEPLNKKLYTYRELRSFTTWSEQQKEVITIRTANFYFEY